MMKKLNFLMLFALTIFLFGCRTELGDIESTQNVPSVPGASKVSFRDFTKGTGLSLDKVQKTSEAIVLSDNSKFELNKKLKGSLEEFNIDTAYVKKLIYGDNETSFTIKAYKNSENPFNTFYNIVYYKFGDQWKAEVFKYTYSKEWLENYNINPKIPFEGNIKHVKTANVDISVGKVYTCAYTVQTLCYCADHTPGQCKGCSAGFRDVAVLDCSEEQTGGGSTISGNPSLGAPPYNDPPMGGGLGTSQPNPYTNGFQYDPSMPEFDEAAFRENNIRYQTWETFGSDWILQHSDLYYKIEAYQVAKNSVNFNFATNLAYNYSNDFAISFLIFLEQNPDITNHSLALERMMVLNNALVQNPNLLLNIPCGELPKWEDLANHPIPTSVKNRIFQLDGQTNLFSSAVIQNLDYSSSYTINMDVYPVKISNMPEKTPGIKYTPEEFFDYFRKNINNFTDVNHGKFYPVVEPQFGIDDTQLWNSVNPLGSLITIKIPADNGTVVCSGFGPQAWIFATVKSPWDGEHPVSGNRLFGYFIEPSSGNMVIYTRGVDRFTTKVSNNALQYTVEAFGYSEAKKMWQTMQQKLSSFVNSKNGSSTIIPGTDYTPNYIFVKDYLKGTKPLTSLGCH
jgi:hypothetical protein